MVFGKGPYLVSELPAKHPRVNRLAIKPPLELRAVRDPPPWVVVLRHAEHGLAVGVDGGHGHRDVGDFVHVREVLS